MKIEIEKFLNNKDYKNKLFFKIRLVQINKFLDHHNPFFKLFDDIKSFFDSTNQ
jgi:hypothetical protein